MSTSTIVYGLYQGQLLPHRLGGLCRGLEWWVEGPFLKTRVPLQRNILSAGEFVNGQVHSGENRFGVEVGKYQMSEMLWHLLSNHHVVAIIEDGTIQSPEGVCGRETYTLSKMGLPKLNEFARWEKECQTVEDIQEALEFGAKAFILDPMSRSEDATWNPVTPLDVEDLDSPPILSENLRQALQWLVGTSNSIGDSHRFVPQALWQVTEYCRGVVVLHADRDTDCIALYSKETIDWSEKLSALPTIVGAHAFWISCPVPTMTLRWKRALYEACDSWNGECPDALRALVPVQEIESVDDNDQTVGESVVDESDNKDAESKEESSEDSE